MAAASVVIILGLALVGVSAVGVQQGNPLNRPDAPEGEGVPSVRPFDPDAENDRVRTITEDAPQVFGTEFGKRGDHEVTVSMSGPGFYQVHWRGQKKVEEGAGQYNRTRTVNGGFPLALIIVNGGGRAVGCTITIDGIEKDTQRTSAQQPAVACQG